MLDSVRERIGKYLDAQHALKTLRKTISYEPKQDMQHKYEHVRIIFDVENPDMQLLEKDDINYLLGYIKKAFPKHFMLLTRVRVTDTEAAGQEKARSMYENPNINILCGTAYHKGEIVFYRNKHFKDKNDLFHVLTSGILDHEFAHIIWGRLNSRQINKYLSAYEKDGKLSVSMHGKSSIKEDFAVAFEKYRRFRGYYQDVMENRFSFIEELMKS